MKGDDQHDEKTARWNEPRPGCLAQGHAGACLRESRRNNPAARRHARPVAAPAVRAAWWHRGANGRLEEAQMKIRIGAARGSLASRWCCVVVAAGCDSWPAAATFFF